MNSYKSIVFLVLLSSLFILSPDAHSQTWDKINGPWSPECEGFFGSYAVFPSNSNKIIIGNEHTEKGCGIYISTDNGATWSDASTGISKVGIYRDHYPEIMSLAVARTAPDIVYAGAGSSYFLTGDIYKSTNGGYSWVRMNGIKKDKFKGFPIDIAVHPNNPDIVYVATAGSGVFKTTDGGNTWIKVKKANAAIDATDYYNSVKISPSSPDIVYISGYTTYSGAFPLCAFIPSGFDCIPFNGAAPLGPYKSNDAGSTWNRVNSPGQGRLPVLITCMAINNSISNEIYASTSGYMTPFYWPVNNAGVFKSVDGGTNWNSINNAGTRNLSEFPVFRVGQAQGKYLLASAGMEGVYRSSDDGANWELITAGLPSNTSVYRMAYGQTMMIVLTSNGLFKAQVNNPPAVRLLASIQHFYPDSYGISIGFGGAITAVQNLSGPNLVTEQIYYGSIETRAPLYARPTIGDTYTFTVIYSDGRSESRDYTVPAINDSFSFITYPTDRAVISEGKPQFAWEAPLGAISYTIGVADITSGTEQWIWGESNIPASRNYAVYNEDGTATATLQSGKCYRIYLHSYDDYGNQATTASIFYLQ